MFYNVTNPGMTVQQGDILVSNSHLYTRGNKDGFSVMHLETVADLEVVGRRLHLLSGCHCSK